MPARIGLFGGSFDPPHFGHLIAAQAAAEQLELDRVLWIPTGDSYHKAPSTPPGHRTAMCELAIAGNDRFELSLVDVDRPGATYSIDTVAAVRAQRVADELVFILGEDAYRSVDSWHRADELRTQVSFAVVHRSGFDGDTQPASLPLVTIPSIGISSSACRERVRAGRSVRYWVPEPVREYIAEHRLYSENA